MKILKIDEIQSCKYILNVATPHICKTEGFKPMQPNIHEIPCAPLIEEEEEDQTQQQQQEENIMLEQNPNYLN